MDLTPDLLLEAKFASARRGYDMNEVDDFLERCAEGLDVLLARLRAEFERAERAEAELAELRAGGAPAASEPGAGAEAATAPEPDPVRVEEPMRILIAAERTAEAAIADARAEAERIRSEAESIASTSRSEAEVLLARARADAEAEARRAGDEARRSIESEVLALREDRDALSADVANLRRWLDENRARVRTAALDLQRLVDDPGSLGDSPAPELAAAPTDEVASPGETGDGESVESGDHVASPDDAFPDDALPDDALPDDAFADGDVVDARTSDDIAGGFHGGFDDDGGEPTQAHPRFESPGALFDDERAPTAFTGSDFR